MERVHFVITWPTRFIDFCTIGLWYYLNGEELPSLTFVGSSNFG